MSDRSIAIGDQINWISKHNELEEGRVVSFSLFTICAVTADHRVCFLKYEQAEGEYVIN